MYHIYLKSLTGGAVAVVKHTHSYEQVKAQAESMMGFTRIPRSEYRELKRQARTPNLPVTYSPMDERYEPSDEYEAHA